MLPDITSNSWARKHFYNIFFKTKKCTIYNHEKSLVEMDAGTLVVAVVAVATAGAAAGGAVAKLVEAVTA
jgi:hypothetical protein